MVPFRIHNHPFQFANYPVKYNVFYLDEYRLISKTFEGNSINFAEQLISAISI